MSFGSIAAGVGEAIGVGFAIYGGQLFFRQWSIVFRPSRETIGNPGLFWEGFNDLYLTLDDQKKVNAWLIPGDPEQKLVLFFPGGIGNLTHELSTLAFLHSFKVSVLALDYPGFGKSDGAPSERGCYAAAEAGWRYVVEEKGIDPSKIVIFGRCLGATVAARLAARHQCSGLICLNAWTSIPDVAAVTYPILPARYFCFLRLNTLKFIVNCRCPVLLMHAGRDRMVPPSHSLRLFEKAHDPKRFLPLNGDHFGNEWQTSPNLRTEIAGILEGRESSS